MALLSELGPSARLTTTVLGAGHLGPGGVWHGDLYLHGGGDPTLGDGAFNRDWEQGYGPTASQLVGQLREAGIKRVTGSVIGDGTLFDALRGGPATAYGPDIPDFGGQLAALTYDHGSTSKGLSPPAFAAKELVLTMRGAHIEAGGQAHGAAPAGAQTLATVAVAAAVGPAEADGRPLGRLLRRDADQAARRRGSAPAGASRPART